MLEALIQGLPKGRYAEGKLIIELHTGIDPLVGLPLIAGVYGSGATESKVSVVSDHRAYFIFSKNENRY